MDLIFTINFFYFVNQAGYKEIPFSDKLYKIYGDLSHVFQMLVI